MSLEIELEEELISILVESGKKICFQKLGIPYTIENPDWDELEDEIYSLYENVKMPRLTGIENRTDLESFFVSVDIYENTKRMMNENL